jgi:8-oxo-dGTP pyrophosphatase MutT (NUDIX family)
VLSEQAGIVKRSPAAAFASHDGAPRTQVGALCWRRAPAGPEVLLVTSRETGRWVIPKGWPIADLTAEAAALREAWEEAGVRGAAGAAVGLFTYDKVVNREARRPEAVPCVVAVFAVEVTERAKDFPEAGQRRVKWFPRDRAARKVHEPALQALILGFDPGPPSAA